MGGARSTRGKKWIKVVKPAGINRMDDQGGDVGIILKRTLKTFRWTCTGLVWDTIESIGRRL